MSNEVAEIMDELDALWKVRFGQPLPIHAQPEVIIRVMRQIEERRIVEQAQVTAAAP